MPVMWGDVLRKLGSLVAPPAGSAVRADGRVWHFSAEGAALFGPAGPAYPKWLADGTAEVVKHGPHRTVYRVALPTGTVYVKHCRINGPRAWAREAMRPPKARLEFENASRLRALGIGAAEPLAWGTPDTRWPGESFLITRDLAPAIPFTEFIESRFSVFSPDEQTRVRRQLARGLGRFLALLHDSGVTHPDPHPGNILVELPGSLVPHLRLLDVHAVRFGSPLSWAESRANLILYNRWFQMRCRRRADRFRFLGDTYRLARGNRCRSSRRKRRTARRPNWSARRSPPTAGSGWPAPRATRARTGPCEGSAPGTSAASRCATCRTAFSARCSPLQIKPSPRPARRC